MKKRQSADNKQVKPYFASFFWLLILSSVVIIPNSLEPYFLGKQIVLIILGLFSLVYSSNYLFTHRKQKNLSKHEIKITFALLSFPTLVLVSSLNSEINKERLIFGNFGRGNGLATLVSLTFIFLFVFLHYSREFKRQLWSFFSIFAKIHVILLVAQYLGFDWLYLNKTYGPVIGFVGNPNFASALLGILLPFLCPHLFDRKLKISESLWLSLSLFAVIVSNSYQGFFGFILIVSFILLRMLKISRHRVIRISGLTLYLSAMCLLFLTFFKIGPLAPYLYKGTMTIRFEYFRSAIEIFKQNPIFGIGTDSFGDHFRAHRSPDLVKLIGETTTTNDAHNFFLNTLSTNGVIGVFPLLIIFCIWIFKIIRVCKEIEKIKPQETAILVGSLIFFFQSLFTVHHLGVSVFGLVLIASVVSITFNENEIGEDSRNYRNSQIRIWKSNTLVLALSILATTLYSERAYNDLKAYEILSRPKDYSTVENQVLYFQKVFPLALYWTREPYKSQLLVEELVRMRATKDAEFIARETFKSNPQSRDAIWTLVAILDVREETLEAIELRRILIQREPSSMSLYVEQIEDLLSINDLFLAEKTLGQMLKFKRYDFSNEVVKAKELIAVKRALGN